MVKETELVEYIEHTIEEKFPNVNVDIHTLATELAEATQEHRLNHINDSPGMTWVDDPEDDSEPENADA